MLILGLDLSSVNTGYSVIEVHPESEPPQQGEEWASKIQLVDYGSIIPKKTMNHAEKIEYIYNNIREILGTYKINIVAMEDQHFAKNASTMKLLCRISGAAMLAAQQSGCEVELYQAKAVKLAFTMNGKASKELMIETAIRKFNLDKNELDDNIADAIGVACTYVIKEIFV